MTAAFYNFEPAMVAQAIPVSWEVVDPAELAAIRADAGARAIADYADPAGIDGLEKVLPLLRQAAQAAPMAGRPLAAANRALWPAIERQVNGEHRVLAEAWQACTTLREHRGDGHVAALVSRGLSGLEAHLLVVGCEDVPVETLRDNRGWSEAQWLDALTHLVARGLLQSDGVATPAGQARRRDVEALTDDLAEIPLAVLSSGERAELFNALRQCAEAIQHSGLYPFPNPMGLPRI
ncbi:MAG TPA: hypothetical protein VGG38_09210 [Acidimicrobiales bacterium]